MEGSAETDPPFGLTTSPTQPPDRTDACAVSPRPLPIVLPPPFAGSEFKPNHLYYPRVALPGAALPGAAAPLPGLTGVMVTTRVGDSGLCDTAP